MNEIRLIRGGRRDGGSIGASCCAFALPAAVEQLGPGVLASPLPSALASLTGRYLLANHAYCWLLAREPEQLRELSVADVTHPEDLAHDTHALRALAAGRLKEVQLSKRYVRPDGSVVASVTRVGLACDGGGRPVALLGHIIDLDDEPAGHEGSLNRERSFHLLFEANPQPMWIFDLKTLRFLAVNDAACAHYGYTRRQFLQMSIADIRPPEELSALHAHLAMSRAPLRNSGVWRHVCADGRVIEVEVITHEILFDGRDAALVAANDITARRRAERQLVKQALHDPVSGLPNRALLLDRLGQMLAASAGERAPVSVLYLDIDHFQLINDSLGYDGGDRLLAKIGARLRQRLPASASAGSIAGEEIAICAARTPDAASARALARQAQAIVGEPLAAAGGKEVRLSACVGVIIAAAHGSEPAMLLDEAALAAAQAKQAGEGQLLVLDRRAGTRGPRRGATDRHQLRHAIESGQIHAHYQPVISLRERVIAGAEALARWSHPERGLIAPGEFIPLAEETGLIIALGRGMLEQACAQAARWPGAGPHGSPLVVSVNVSTHQLRDGGLAALVRAVLARSGLAPARLALEMTETALIDGSDTVVAELSALRQIGVHLALDDFGTGYSSLMHLYRFPLDVLKIDRTFITGMTKDDRRRAIVVGAISLANELKAHVVAEGVENETEAAALAHLGADYAQGHLFHAAMPDRDLTRLLARTAAPPPKQHQLRGR